MLDPTSETWKSKTRGLLLCFDLEASAVSVSFVLLYLGTYLGESFGRRDIVNPSLYGL